MNIAEKSGLPRVRIGKLSFSAQLALYLQILLPDLGLGIQLLNSSLKSDMSLCHQIETVAERHGNFEVMPGLVLNGQYVYLQGQEDGTDSRSDGFDSGYVFNVGAEYTITDNATAAVTYLMADWDDIEGTIDPETFTAMVARLQVNF